MDLSLEQASFLSCLQRLLNLSVYAFEGLGLSHCEWDLQGSFSTYVLLNNPMRGTYMRHELRAPVCKIEMYFCEIPATWSLQLAHVFFSSCYKDKWRKKSISETQWSLWNFSLSIYLGVMICSGPTLPQCEFTFWCQLKGENMLKTK